MATEPKRKTVVERYFEKRFVADVKGNSCEDQCVLLHSNKVCMITIAEGHPLLKSQAITAISFQVTPKLNRLDNKVTGKGKHGGQWLDTKSPLCVVTSSSGKTYTLYSCIRGKLIEVNKELVSHPELMLKKPGTEGYIAIVLPRLTDVDSVVNGTITSDDYKQILQQREQQITLTAVGGTRAEDIAADNSSGSI